MGVRRVRAPAAPAVRLHNGHVIAFRCRQWRIAEWQCSQVVTARSASREASCFHLFMRELADASYPPRADVAR